MKMFASSLENTSMPIAGLPRWWSICPLLLLVILLLIGCVDQAAKDDRECQSKGFNVNAKEYAYCREKLQQFRDEDLERRTRIKHDLGQ